MNLVTLSRITSRMLTHPEASHRFFVCIHTLHTSIYHTTLNTAVSHCISYLIIPRCSSCHTWILSSHWSLLSLCCSRTLERVHGMSETSHCICAHTVTSLLINTSINIPLASQLHHKNIPGNTVLLQGSLETQQSVFWEMTSCIQLCFSLEHYIFLVWSFSHYFW